MSKPVYALQARLAEAFQTASRAPGLLLVFVVGQRVLPAVLLSIAGLLTRSQSTSASLGSVVMRYTLKV